jgi:2-polyprenyl-3-methyl-5-hydroxy-6-metoxy-1,4-benzoquinol methylase
VDKAGKQYWNDSWAISSLPRAVDPRRRQLDNWVNRRFDRLFQRLFANVETEGLRLLEIGCAKSAWLPYFAKEFGFRVSGLDYSPRGCEMARAVLDANGIEPDIVCADLFSPPDSMMGQFDVVVSFGVVEHFDDTASCLAAVSRFLKPGGMVITNIPNMVGSVGSVQKALNRPVFDIHQLIDPARLRDAHERAGLTVLECEHFLFTSFGVSNLAGISIRTITGLSKKILLGILARLSMCVWLIEDMTGDLPPNEVTSPYINCIARKRQPAA